MHLSTLNLTDNEIVNTKEFKQVVLQLINIKLIHSATIIIAVV